MLIALFQVVFAAICTVSKSALNVILYQMLLRICNKWLGLNGFMAFACSIFCLSKIVKYIQRFWFNFRIKHKKPDEKIVINELTFESPMNKSSDQFDTDWNQLIDDDGKSMFPTIVNIPFTNGLLFLITIVIIEYQMNQFDYSYIMSITRILACLVVLVCGSCVRYQTLFERDKKNFFNLMIKKRDEIERYIIYYNNIPVASVCLQILDSPQSTVFMVQLYQNNSKFDDYLYDIGFFISGKLIERIENYGKEHKKMTCLVWSIPSCKQKWKYPILAKKILLRNSYKDFSFLPFVNSYVEQYQYVYTYQEPPTEIVNE